MKSKAIAMVRRGTQQDAMWVLWAWLGGCAAGLALGLIAIHR